MDQCLPLTPLPQAAEAPAPHDAVTVRRVALLMVMAEDAQRLARKVLAQVQRCSFIEPKDGIMFARFDRAARQSIMLAAKLEADARRAAPVPARDAAEAAVGAAAAAAVGAAAGAVGGFDAMTLRRVALLMDVAEDAATLGRMVREQAERWVDGNDGFLFDIFDRAARQSVMLAGKLEADARRLAAGRPEAAEAAVAQPVAVASGDGEGAGDGDADWDGGGDFEDEQALERPQAASQPHRLDEPQAADRLHRPQALHELPDAPVGVLVARIGRALKRRVDLREFSDAELGHDRERCRKAASGARSQKRLPMGWIEGVDGQPVKIGVERKDMFAPAPPGGGRRAGRDPPD